jgi:hypothetical protein
MRLNLPRFAIGSSPRSRSFVHVPRHILGRPCRARDISVTNNRDMSADLGPFLIALPQMDNLVLKGGSFGRCLPVRLHLCNADEIPGSFCTDLGVPPEAHSTGARSSAAKRTNVGRSVRCRSAPIHGPVGLLGARLDVGAYPGPAHDKRGRGISRLTWGFKKMIKVPDHILKA